MMRNLLRIKFLSLCFILLSYSPTLSLPKCRYLEREIQQAHYFFFGIDFPYQYSIAQVFKESQCRHNIISTDGVGSEGFAQITYSVWRNQLNRIGIYEIKSIPNHAKAQAYINFVNYQNSKCKLLFEMYQRYNGGALVTKELEKAKSCKWEDGLRVCRRRDVCVLFKNNQCLQYRNACEINYSYSLNIYEIAHKFYKFIPNSKYQFF